MIIERTPVNRASKDILARCMATEDIRVIHDKNSDTAWFDTENRILCLPIWKDMSNSMYDMLVGHEVSHALHTPAKGWQKFVGEGAGSRMRHTFINVVEDARIERLIKDKFPGLRRDFSNAYHEFADRDLFELANHPIDINMPLIDRLNLHFKIGLFGIETIPFLANEQQYVTRMANTEKFKEVMELAKELYELQVEQDAEEDENGESQPSPESGDESGEQGDNGQSDEDSGQSKGESQSGDGDEQGEDSGQSQTDDTDDGESANSESGDSEQSDDGQMGLDYDDYSEGAGSTQQSFDQGVKNMRNDKSDSYGYHTLPTMKIENCVIDYNAVNSIWEDYAAEYNNPKTTSSQYADRILKKRVESLTQCNEFLNRIKSTVANMVQQFQMKQAADADKRTDIAKTGILDTVSMIQYRWSEDIFLKNEVHADGKNHGIIMYIDWSGSMCGIIRDTVEQLLILTEFCQKVNIPFDVYAFSSKRIQGERNDDGYFIEPQYIVDESDSQQLKPHDFSLIQFLSSDMKTNVYKQAVQNLYYLGRELNHYGGYIPRDFQMGCTPLNEAVISAIQMVPAFQAKHNIQIVNTVFLSDGDGHGMGAHRGYSGDKSFVHDPKTRKDYEVTRNVYSGETDIYLQILQDRTGTNIIGIRLHEGKNIRTLQYRYFENQDMTEISKSWKKHNFTTVEGQGYDKLFIVRGNLKVETNVLEELADDASYTKLKNAFMKGANSAKSSRVIATQLIDIIAN